jgi:Bacterial pre-peptidase C-terminal domain
VSCSSWTQTLRTLCLLVLIPTIFQHVGFSADKLEWTRIFPAGAQAGTTVDIEATGKFPDWPLDIWSDTDAITWSCQSEPGKLQATVDSFVPAGLHWVRLFSKNGSTSVRPFLVGNTPQRNETEPNDRTNEANAIDDFPQTIHGILAKKGDADSYAVKLTAGQLLVATIDAAKLLQSPVDTNLQILDAHGFVLAENLDHVGLDPYIEFTAPQDGQYIIRVLGFPATPDSKIGFSGGSDWLYRLRLESKAGAFGNPIAYPLPTELDATNVRLKPAKYTSQDQAKKVELPSRIRGIISAPNQTQYIRFLAHSGTHYRVRVFAREFGSPLDATVAIHDASGKQLKQTDDVASNRDPEIRWDAPKDDDYFVAISDFHRYGGKKYEYMAIIEQQNEDFKLSIANDWIQSTVNKEVHIKVNVTRENKFSRTVRVEVDGLPESVSCAMGESTNDGDSSKTLTLKIKSTEPYQGHFRIIGRTTESPDDIRVATSENNKPIWLSIAPE